MVTTVAALGAAVLAALLLVSPTPAPAAVFYGWGFVLLLVAQATCTVLVTRPGTSQRVVLNTAVFVWMAAVLFAWVTGMFAASTCGVAAAVMLVFATSEFGYAAGTLTLCLLTAMSAGAMYAEGGARELTFLPVFAIALAVLLALTVQLVRDHDKVTAQLQALAGVDALTGLVTRRVMDEALASALTASGSSVGTGLLLIDMDEFKTVNDVHGHPGGDAALQHVAKVLTAAVGSDAVVCRLGGDEMAVLLPSCPLSVLARRAEDVVRAVREAPLVLPDGSQRNLTVSVGGAHTDTHGADVQALYAAADASLYTCKAAGRDRAALEPAPVGSVGSGYRPGSSASVENAPGLVEER